LFSGERQKTPRDNDNQFGIEKTYINANMLYLLNLMHFKNTHQERIPRKKTAKLRATEKQTKIKVAGKKGLTE
jgi:hypothetical protein